jgi:RNA polymerase sigma-70 factor, ECF subfamily
MWYNEARIISQRLVRADEVSLPGATTAWLNMEYDETKIIARVQRGEAEAFTELYDAYVKKIYDFIYYRTFHRETAEDLTSQVFFKALDNISSFRTTKGNFSSWLYRIARNTVIDHTRTRKVTDNLSVHEHLTDATNLVKDTDRQLLEEQVKKILANLSPEARDVVVMRIWDELSYADIAAITGKTEASLKMLFSRTISKLQQQVQSYD